MKNVLLFDDSTKTQSEHGYTGMNWSCNLTTSHQDGTDWARYPPPPPHAPLLPRYYLCKYAFWIFNYCYLFVYCSHRLAPHRRTEPPPAVWRWVGCARWTRSSRWTLTALTTDCCVSCLTAGRAEPGLAGWPGTRKIIITFTGRFQWVRVTPTV